MTWPQMTTIKFGSEKQNSEVKLPRKLMVQLPCNKLPCKDMVKQPCRSSNAKITTQK